MNAPPPGMVAGRTGRSPIGARLVMGKKKAAGNGFEDKDRFSIMSPRAAADDRRIVHPDFAWYDALPPELRRSVVCTIAHARWEDALLQMYRAQRPPADPRAAVPPGRRPWCTGDGCNATRWRKDERGGPDAYQPVPCPGDGVEGRAPCHFRRRVIGGDGKAVPLVCRIATALRFRLSLPAEVVGGRTVPTPVVEYVTQGEEAHDAIRGLREDLDRTAAALGVTGYSPIGYQFTLTMREVSKPPGPGYPRGRRYWTVDVSPTVSAADFLVGAAQRHRLLASGAPEARALLAATPDPIHPDDLIDALDEVTP